MALPLQSPELDAWASGFPVTLLHGAVALAIFAAAAALYALLTPHREIQLVREGNPAAAVSFGSVLVALAAPLAFALAASTSVLDVALWGFSTVVVQLFLFWLIDLVFVGLPQRVREGEVGAAVLLGAARLATGALLAAAVTG
jgi:putative membrane protein